MLACHSHKYTQKYTQQRKKMDEEGRKKGKKEGNVGEELTECIRNTKDWIEPAGKDSPENINIKSYYFHPEWDSNWKILDVYTPR